MNKFFPDKKMSWKFDQADFQKVRLRLKEIIRSGNQKRKADDAGDYLYGEFDKGLWYIYQNSSRKRADGDLKFTLRFIENSENVYMKINVKNRFWILLLPAAFLIWPAWIVLHDSPSLPLYIPLLITTGVLLFFYLIARVRFYFSKKEIKRFAESTLLEGVDLI
jgi:hypothetical protein